MLKKIKHNIFISNLMNAIALSCFVGLGIIFMIAFFEQGQQFTMACCVIGIMMIVFCVLSMMITTHQYHQIKKRYKQTITTPIEESYTKVAKELFLGSHYMIYHSGLKYLFFAKKDITNMTYTTKGRKMVLAIYTHQHPEGEAITIHKYDTYLKEKINSFLAGTYTNE